MSSDDFGFALPIETRYRGFRFRSRLEARWAVFFDAMQIGFQYEPEGFALSGAIRYLPDFYLPQVRMWAECKPVDPTESEKEKAKRLVIESGVPLLWLVGPPDFRDYSGLMAIVLEDPPDLFTDEWTWRIDIYEGRGLRYYHEEHRFFSDPYDELTEAECSSQFKHAVYAARSARFDGRDLPRTGHEPFNLSDREMGESQ